MIVGLTGPMGAGKGTAAEFLRSRGFRYHSLSDVLREELEARGEEPTRDALTRIGNELRARYGPGVLAERIVGRLTDAENHVVDSIRNPAEVEVLRAARPDFFLVSITAPPEVRWRRLAARGRPGDPQTFESFMAQEQREAASADPSHQQLLATMALADYTVDNSGDIEALEAALTKIVQDAARRVRRPGWDHYFMGIAEVAARRSNCVKRRVGAVIVSDRRVLSTGYNGTPRGARNCNEGGCPRCNNLAPSGSALEECLCSHAEENALTQAAYHGVSVRGATIYTTFSPCLQCTKMIVNAGIAEVVYKARYTIAARALALLAECGVTARPLDDE